VFRLTINDARSSGFGVNPRLSKVTASRDAASRPCLKHDPENENGFSLAKMREHVRADLMLKQ